MKRALILTLLLCGAGAAVSTARHHRITKEACCEPPICLPGDPSPPCPQPVEGRK